MALWSEERGLRFGKWIEQSAYTDEELLDSLHNSIKLHEHAVRRSQSFMGRLYGLLFFRAWTDPDNIEIDGTRLRQLYALAEYDPPHDITADEAYDVDILTLRSLLVIAASNAKAGQPKWLAIRTAGAPSSSQKPLS